MNTKSPSSDRQWLELGRPTIAEVATFPYVALSPEGKIDLAPYPHTITWLERIKQLPGFVGMPGIDEEHNLQRSAPQVR